MTNATSTVPLTVRIGGEIDKSAAADLVATLHEAGWAAMPLRPKHATPELVVTLTGLTAAMAALLRALPPILEQWRDRHRLREIEVIVERDGREVHRISAAARSDAATMARLVSAIDLSVKGGRAGND